jgi:hypothetical protein
VEPARLRWLWSLALLIPAVLAGVAGYAQFQDGWARDEALPIPNYLLRNLSAPQGAYLDAARALSQTSRANGEDMILQAQAAIAGGADPASNLDLIEQALAASPASSRGWLLLAHAAVGRDRQLAGKAANLGFLLGPYDFWLAGVRAQQAIKLWDLMDADTRTMALANARMLWDVPELRQELLIVLNTQDGVKLVGRAFQGRKNDVADMNRWILDTESRKSPNYF